jgi:hypothetical protein
MRRTTLTLLASALLLVGLAGPAGPAAAASDSPGLNPGLPVYLAMGDSLANGQASAPETTDYWTTVAGWRANGYVAQFDAWLKGNLDCLPAHSSNASDGCRQLQLLNLPRSGVPAEVHPPDGLPGVTSDIVIDEQLPTAVALLRSRNGDANPRNDVEVVTIDVGGNEIFDAVMGPCLLATDKSGCPAAISAAFSHFAANFGTILGSLRAAAGPDATIITMTYFNTLPGCPFAAAAPFADWLLQGLNTDVFGPMPMPFNNLITQISAVYGARVADTFGHVPPTDLVGDCKHALKSGHTDIATAFEAAFAE